MPGFSFIHYFESVSKETSGPIEPHLTNLPYESKYEKQVFLDKATTFLATTVHTLHFRGN